MFRMKSMVMTGVLVYGIFLVALHQTFMAGPKETQHDMLVHAIQRDKSRLATFQGLDKFRLSTGMALKGLHPVFMQKSFNMGLETNISGSLDTIQAFSNFSSHPVVKDWSALMKAVVPEGLVHQIQPGDTSSSVISRLEKSPRSMNYPSFNLTLPRLESDADAKLFMRNPENQGSVGVQPSEKLFGYINVLHNVTITYETDCGFKTKNKDFYPPNENVLQQDSVIKGVVIPILVPDSHAFQHFIDGLLPKLIQVLDLALLPGVQLLIFYPRDSIIFEMLETLGIPKQKLLFYPNHPLHLNTVINTCITPPLHPLLWGSARRLLKVPDKSPSPRDSIVILLTRAGSYNPGRNMLNIIEVKNMLSLRYGKRLVIFKGGLNLKESTALFSQAAVILGVHGGAFYNLLFAPRSTHIIEFMPFDSYGFPIPGTAHQIFWMQSQLIGQPYWRLQLTPHAAGDVLVPVANLTAILDKVDKAVKTPHR